MLDVTHSLKDMIKNIITTVEDKPLRRQLALMLGENGYFKLLNFNEDDAEQYEEDDEVPLADVR